MVVDDPDKPYKEPDSTTTIATQSRLKFTGNPLRTEYYDFLGNRLKGVPQFHGKYLRKDVYANGVKWSNLKK